MKQMIPKVSIILVHYHCPQEIINCIQSIEKTTTHDLYEIIVVDNDEHKTLLKQLQQKHILINYIPNENKGFGQGCNLGSQQAKGEYLFFLNPDTIVQKNCIQTLIYFLDTHQDFTAAPTLLNPKGDIYPLQGASLLTPLKAIFSQSLISRIFPHNHIAQQYWNSMTKKKQIYYVDVLPGTAFMMRKTLFEKLHGFDEHFFLYFEESDLFHRAHLLHQKQVILSNATVIHIWGQSTKQNAKSHQYFLQSRWYFFKKWYGIFPALITEGILRFGSTQVILLTCIILGGFLRLIHPEITPFIGDQGWFYLSARDALIQHTVPLTGITSSHTWLTQGPTWTYIIMLCFALTKFNPISPVVGVAIINTLALLLIFSVGRKYLHTRAGLIATAIAATSPLLIMHSRMAYHTSLIFPVSLLFLWGLSQFRDTSRWYLPLVTFTLGLMFTLEVATVTYVFASIVFFVLDRATRYQFIQIKRNKRLLILSSFSFLFPLIPFLSFNLRTQFHQFFMMIAWIGYKIFLGGPTSDPTLPFLTYSNQYIQRLLFLPRTTIAILLFITLHVLFLTILGYAIRKRTWGTSENILLSFYLVPLGLYIVQHIPSEGYIPMLFAGFVLMTGYIFIHIHIIGKTIFLGIFTLITTVNLIFFFSHQFLTTPDLYGYSLETRQTVVQQALSYTQHKTITIIFKGPLDIFPSNRMNYEFLAWYDGAHIDANHPQEVITITDTGKHLTAQVQ